MKLTQNDLKYIIHESTKRVLNEISIRDAYTRFYQDIPEILRILYLSFRPYIRYNK